MQTVYAVMTNDDAEGRGPQTTLAIFADRDAAAKVAANTWCGRVVETHVYNSVGDWETHKKSLLRKKLLDRLSREELEALGL